MKELVEKIQEQLKPSGWRAQLRFFLMSQDFEKILVKLKQLVDDNFKFVPSISTMFNYMRKRPFEGIRVIMFVDYNSNIISTNCGIPLSTEMDIYGPFGNTKPKPCTQLQNILPEIPVEDIDADLKFWLKQGVFIFPLATTCFVEGKGHKELWRPLVIRIIEALNKTYKNTPWILLGEYTFAYEKFIESPHIRKISKKKYAWKDSKWRDWVNQILLNKDEEPIRWIQEKDIDVKKPKRKYTKRK